MVLPIYQTLFDLGEVEIFPSQTFQYWKSRQTSIKSLDYQPLTSTRSDENLSVKVNRAFSMTKKPFLGNVAVKWFISRMWTRRMWTHRIQGRLWGKMLNWTLNKTKLDRPEIRKWTVQMSKTWYFENKLDAFQKWRRTLDTRIRADVLCPCCPDEI